MKVTREMAKELLNKYEVFKLDAGVNEIMVENKNDCLYLTIQWKIGNNRTENKYVTEDDVIDWLHRNYELIQVS
ncbi:hypothetical protein EDM57_04985 [Brevibacillus gelatini]|uniref:Uncharacterized protein n=1 Tax=Brevibacillus gelatini TaxID=1655277 RepID=A0A3M8B939_9BACL|nr:hypothetical protein [Brevibacillus gelatini]RNB59497.1 hypothetical protein EDM57_04985 [Brevibacillus gelatini]